MMGVMKRRRPQRASRQANELALRVSDNRAIFANDLEIGAIVPTFDGHGVKPSKIGRLCAQLGRYRRGIVEIAVKDSNLATRQGGWPPGAARRRRRHELAVGKVQAVNFVRTRVTADARA